MPAFFVHSTSFVPILFKVNVVCVFNCELKSRLLLVILWLVFHAVTNGRFLVYVYSYSSSLLLLLLLSPFVISSASFFALTEVVFIISYLRRWNQQRPGVPDQSQLPRRLSAQQRMHLENHNGGRILCGAQVPVIWGKYIVDEALYTPLFWRSLCR